MNDHARPSSKPQLKMKLFPRNIIVNIPRSWQFSFATWGFFRIILSVWGWLIWKTQWITFSDRYYYDVTPIDAGWRGALLGIWLRWDAIHYFRIAESGYYTDLLSAFFPLFPMLGGITANVLRIEMLVGLIIVSNISLLFAAVLLYQLSEQLFTHKVAELAVVTLLVHPFAVFLYAPYTESVALLFVLLTYTTILKKNWLLATVSGFAAGLSRGTVIPLVAALLWVVWQNRNKLTSRAKFLALSAAFSPAIGTASFLIWRITRGFQNFNTLLLEQWGRETSIPFQELYFIIDLLKIRSFPASSFIKLVLLIMVLFITIWMIRKLPTSLMIFQISTLFFTLSTSVKNDPLGSWGRYSLIIFPTFIGFGLWANTPFRRLGLVGALSGMMLFIAGLFFLWGWVG